MHPGFETQGRHHHKFKTGTPNPDCLRRKLIYFNLDLNIIIDVIIGQVPDTETETEKQSTKTDPRGDYGEESEDIPNIRDDGYDTDLEIDDES